MQAGFAEVFYLMSLILLGTLIVLSADIGVIGRAVKLEDCLQKPCSIRHTQDVLEHCSLSQDEGQIVTCASPEVPFDMPFFCETASRCSLMAELPPGVAR